MGVPKLRQQPTGLENPQAYLLQRCLVATPTRPAAILGETSEREINSESLNVKFSLWTGRTRAQLTTPVTKSFLRFTVSVNMMRHVEMTEAPFYNPESFLNETNNPQWLLSSYSHQ